MSYCHSWAQEHGLDTSLLINKLYKRSTLAPIKTNQGNECILIDLSDCAHDFLRFAEDFFAESERFQLMIKGMDYYVEVLHGDSFSEAYRKSLL